MSTIHERILHLRRELGLSRAQLGLKCGVTQQAVYGWEEDGAVPSRHRMPKVAEALKTTVEWLSAGIDVNVPLAAKYTLIPLLGTHCREGSDVQHHDEVGDLLDDHNSFAYRRDFLRELNVQPDWCRVYLLDKHDKSMTLGHQLLVDTNPEHAQIEDGRVYLLDTPAGCQVRRLYLQIDGQVRVRADRAEVPEQTVALAALKVLGRVVAHQGTL